MQGMSQLLGIAFQSTLTCIGSVGECVHGNRHVCAHTHAYPGTCARTHGHRCVNQLQGQSAVNQLQGQSAGQLTSLAAYHTVLPPAGAYPQQPLYAGAAPMAAPYSYPAMAPAGYTAAPTQPPAYGYGNNNV